MNEPPIPEVALKDPYSVEMLRVWVSGGQLYCLLKVGMYCDGLDIHEKIAWEGILADAACHLAKVLLDVGNMNEAKNLVQLVEKFNEEVSAPSSENREEFFDSFHLLWVEIGHLQCPVQHPLLCVPLYKRSTFDDTST
jgi:hypothetical protein